MKIVFTYLLLLIASFPLFSQSTPEEVKFEIGFKDQPLKTCLIVLEAASEVQFVYSDKLVEDQSLFNLRHGNRSLKSHLDLLFKGSSIAATFKGNMVVIHPKETTENEPPPKFTISGYIEEKGSGERLAGAVVYDQRTRLGVITNNYGYFSLNLVADSVTLMVSYLGYQKVKLPLLLDQNQSLILHLSPNLVLETVEITDAEMEAIERKTEMGTIEIPMAQIKLLPSLLGEVDVIKTMQLLPGVQSGSEGSSFLYVRGGGPDQNLILLDGVPVYNSSHLFGLFSIFNADAVQDVKLIKSAFPARYGGRLSSVLDIRMREGNAQKFKSEGSLGLTGAKLTLEGPIKQGKGSFIISGRRTLVDLVTRSFSLLSGGGYSQNYWFGDLNAKLNWRIGKKDRVYFSSYSGKDRFNIRNRDQSDGVENIQGFGFQWGSVTTALRWNHEFSHKVFANFTATLSDYKYENYSRYISRPPSGIDERQTQSIQSGIRDYALRADFDYLPNSHHHIRFGGAAIPRRFRPEVTSSWDYNNAGSQTVTSLDENDVSGIENLLYLEDDMEIGNRIGLNLGLHASHFKVESSNYFSLQPRISTRYLLNNTSSLKASYSRMTQYMHLVSNSGVGMPTDLWIPVSDSFPPMQSRQVSLGYAKRFPSQGLEFTVEGYYKEMDQLIEYSNGANFFTSNTWDEAVEKNGTGKSYGVEIFVHKKQGRWNGFAGYTLSRSDRQFAALNGGQRFPYKYDRTHDISIALIYHARKGLDFSGSWVYGTGNAISFPKSLFYGNSNPYAYNPWHSPANTTSAVPIQIDHGDRNSFRVPSYHRLDLNCTMTKDKKWGELLYHFGVYNAYSRRNPFFVYLAPDSSGSTTHAEIKARLVSLFPAIPYFTLHLKFNRP